MIEKLEQIFQRLSGIRELEVRVQELTKRQDQLSSIVLKHEREIGELAGRTQSLLERRR